MTLQAITTRYNGYKFRSRLEARWAIFFDAMGIEWRYEQEGYRLKNGTYYLPDFYLPQTKMFAEVKPDKLTPGELRKVKQLARESRRPVLMMIGPPDFINYDAWEIDPWSDTLMRFDYSLVPWYIDEGRFPCMNFCPSGYADAYGSLYFTAVMVARAARFEHGETPWMPISLTI